MMKYPSALRPVCMSRMFRPIEAIPKENIPTASSCKSYKLMLKNGLIAHSSPGVFNLLPLAIISLEKLCALIDSVMRSIGGQKVLFPTLSLGSLWKKSGRWVSPNAQLFKLKDRHGVDYCLGPTHEEVVTSLVSGSVVPLKSLPLRLYQISTKFRDELNPKLGLLRGREFLMKDMYTFDDTEEKAKVTYSEMCEGYDKFFHQLGVPFVKVQGSSAGMGGSLSHEYHFLSDVGEDEVLLCPTCKIGLNEELAEEGSEKNCSVCKGPLEKHKGIEVGHAFYLGKTYSDPFKALFKAPDGTAKVLEMGCYGLGVTRILAASIECLSSDDNIRWPLSLAPFLISLIPPKKGSKEENANYIVEYLFNTFSQKSHLENSVVIDDRVNLTIGKRVQEANSVGIPYSIVIGSSVLDPLPKFEVIDNYCNKKFFMSHLELMSYFSNFGNRIL